MTTSDADDDIIARIAPGDASAGAGASAPSAEPSPCPVSPHVAHARRAARTGNGKFAKMYEPKPKPPPVLKTRRSQVTNGKLFITGPATTAASRQLVDILHAIVNDLGGPDNLSEAERQLARRAASLSVACERLEQTICGGPSSAEAAFMSATGGLSSYRILNEAGIILHGIARARGGNSIAAIAALPDPQLDRVTDLLMKAGDLAARCIAAGSAQSADLELYGMLADRCGRTFSRIGLRRRPREITDDPLSYAATYADRDVDRVAPDAANDTAREGELSDTGDVELSEVEP